MNRRWRTALGLILAWVPAAAGALTYVPVTDANLVDSADAIVRAHLASSRVGDETGRVMTSYRFAVLDRLKGSGAGSEITVRVPGGIDLERELAVKIFGVPEFERAQTALLFLRASADGSYRVLHVFQGAFVERLDAGRRVYDRAGAEALAVEKRGAPMSAGPARREPLRIRARERVPRDSRLFESWIRDRLAGLHRPADYLRSGPFAQAGPSPLTAQFTTLTGNDLVIRWFEVDERERIGWYRHEDGQAGFSAGGSKAFKKARKAWRRKFSGVPIKLTNLGKTSSTTGFTISDSRNTLLHRDFNDTIGEDFDCDEGGVLAIGGLSLTDFIPVTWKGLAAVASREAEIVMNDGIECFLDGDSDTVAQIYAHELGHTLGLGHSCGDDASPSCSKSAFLADALMVAAIGNVFGAEIHDDDVLAARQFYDEDFWAAPCAKRVPGATGFCRKCGPCGEGQGNCRNDGDCFGSLACTKDIGAGFGFDADVNVCTLP